MRKTSFSLGFGVVLSMVIVLGLASVYPNVDDLWVENGFWNGLSTFHDSQELTRVSRLADLGSLSNLGSSTLFIIGPYQDFTTGDADRLTDFLLQGGRLVLADDYGTGNQLLGLLGLDARFDAVVLRDPIFREKNILMPIIETQGISSVGSVVLNIPTRLLNVQDSTVVAWSSPVSYATETLEDIAVEYNRHPVIAEIPYGGGYVVLISDSSIFINSMITRGDNQALVDYLSQGTALLDEAHSMRNRLTVVQTGLHRISSFFSYFEVRYITTLLAVALIMSLRFDIKSQPVNHVEELLKQHPEYDRSLIEWLQNEREKARK